MRASKLFKRKLKNNHIVNDLKIDSRLVEKNDVFFAIKGKVFDGNDFVISAVENGAKTIVLAKKLEELHFPGINILETVDVEKELAVRAKIFYVNISGSLTLIGVTGTNGKTTVTTLLYKYFQFLNKKASLIGTNGIYIMNNFFSSPNTTPNILEIYRVLKESKRVGAGVVIMEVSSHAIKMMRVWGLEFKIILITNLTRDHLDFHGTMEDYKYTKASFMASECDRVIINHEIDDFSLFYRAARGRAFTFGAKGDYTFTDPVHSITKTTFTLNTPKESYSVVTGLPGRFNIYNILAFIAVTDALGLFSNKTISYLNTNINILGRLEVAKVEDKYFVIDFAHTPDGIKNVLEFLNEIKEHRLYVIIGCGGDRDRGKRKVIGGICTEIADFVVFTNDNPRSEEPEQIIDDILEGVKSNNYWVLLNRKKAIEEVYRLSLKGDIIAILGKGNEQYQIIGRNKIPFNDKAVVLGLGK